MATKRNIILFMTLGLIILSATHCYSQPAKCDSMEIYIAERDSAFVHATQGEKTENNDFIANCDTIDYDTSDIISCDTSSIFVQELDVSFPAIKEKPLSIYDLPYSVTGKYYDWRHLWINTATLAGAFIGTLVVLECLPEDATSWNRAELRDVPLFTRWRDHVIKEGPEWDHDKFYFNYILHPYAGAVYYMSARSCGFNAWQSLLYCSLVSNVGWEYGIEAFMERPSIQDLFITPLLGSAIGECFYKLKRNIVSNGYTLCGSPVLGNIVAFLIDPVNEVVGLVAGNPCRQAIKRNGSGLNATTIIAPSSRNINYGVSICYTF